MTERLIAERYRLGRMIGAGGMGKVWLALDEVLRRPVAVKEVLFPEGLSEAEAAELRMRTLREARTAARLSHPNVIKIFDVIYAEQRPWIVMEYVPSRSLAQILKQDGPMSPARAAQLGLALLGALGAAHDANVLHRDVKPGNVLLGDDGRVVLTDFGLATFDEVGPALTQTGIVHGSPQFIAPERALDGTSTPAADMWSLGATLYAAVEGRSPYSRASSYATLTALATSPPDPPRRAGPLKPVLSGLMRRNPKSRMGPDEVRVRLQRLAVTEPPWPRIVARQRRADDSSTIETDAAARVAQAARQVVTPKRAISQLPPSLWRRPAGQAPVPPPTGAGTQSAFVPPRTGTPVPGAPSGRRNRREFDEPQAAPVRALDLGLTPEQPPRPGSRDASAFVGDLDRDLDRWPGTADPSETPRMPLPRAPRHALRIRWIAGIASVVVLIAVTALLVVAHLRGGGKSPEAPIAGRAGASPSASQPAVVTVPVTFPCAEQAPPGTSAVPSPRSPKSPAATSYGLPVGWVRYADESGRDIALPKGWQIALGAVTTCAYDPTSKRVAGASRFIPAKPDPVTALLEQQTALLATGVAGYHLENKIAVDPYVPGHASWEYTYDGTFGRVHVLIRDVINANGSVDEMSWSTLETDWVINDSNRNLVITTFDFSHR